MSGTASIHSDCPPAVLPRTGGAAGPYGPAAGGARSDAAAQAQPDGLLVNVELTAVVHSVAGTFVIVQSSSPLPIGDIVKVAWAGSVIPATVQDCEPHEGNFMIGLAVERGEHEPAPEPGAQPQPDNC